MTHTTEKQRTALRIPIWYLELIQTYIDENLFMNKAEFVRYALLKTYLSPPRTKAIETQKEIFKTKLRDFWIPEKIHQHYKQYPPFTYISESVRYALYMALQQLATQYHKPTVPYYVFNRKRERKERRAKPEYIKNICHPEMGTIR